MPIARRRSPVPGARRWLLRRRPAGLALLNLMALVLHQPAHAMDVYWGGGEGLWWSDAAWVDGLVPDVFDRVFIDGAANAAVTSLVRVDSWAFASEVFITAGDTLKIEQASLTIYGGQVSNQGRLVLEGSALVGAASLKLAADTTLGGSGTTVLASEAYSGVQGNGHMLTIQAGHSVTGAGKLGADGNLNVINRGQLIADGGRLSLSMGDGNSFNNLAGTVTVNDGATLGLDSGSLRGGDITGIGGARLSGSGTYEGVRLGGSLRIIPGSFFTLRNTQLSGQLAVESGSYVALAGTFISDGTLVIQGSASLGAAVMEVTEPTTLGGSGTTVLTNQDYSQIHGSGNTLTIAAGHTLRGAGAIGADGRTGVVNLGNIVAEGGRLTVSPGALYSVDNGAGTITVADNGVLSLDSGTLSGGSIIGQGGAQLGGSGSFESVRLRGTLRTTASSSFTLKDSRIDGELTVAPGATTYLAGTITNTGKLSLQGSADKGTAALVLSADATLAGNGSTVLGSQDYAALHGNGHVLTIEAGHTLRGAGSIGADGITRVVNRGNVIVEGGRMVLEAGSGNGFDNVSGSITVASSGVLRLDGITLSGGRITGHGHAQLSGYGTYDKTRLSGTLSTEISSTFLLKDVQLDGQFSAMPMASPSIAGLITNTGRLTIQGTSGGGFSAVRLAADTKLAGSGQTVLQNEGRVTGGGRTLTIAQGHTLRGAGTLGADGSINIVNQGSLVAEGGLLTLSMQSGQHFDNTAGLIRIDDTGQMQLYGDLLLGNASQLVFDVAKAGGQAAWGGLDWHAPATFDGTLRLSFDGYTPIVGQQFSLIHFDGSYSGAFDAALANGYTLSLSYADNWVVATVTGVAPVPEPGTWALWLAGAGVLGAVTRRRTRCA